MKRTLVFLVFGLAALLWGETVINGSRSILGTWNAGGAASTIPAKVGNLLPEACVTGEQFFKSDATAGQNIHLCTAPNTWTQVTGGGGGGSSEAMCTPGDSRYICWQDDMMTGLTTSGMVGLMGWQTDGAGGSTAQMGTNLWPYTGAIRLTTGATSGNVRWLSLSGGGPLGNWFANASRDSEIKFGFRLVDHTTSNFRVVVGAINVSNVSVQDGFGVGKDGSGNFALYLGVGGEQASPASFGVAVDSNWHTVRFWTDPAVNQRVYVTLDDSVTRTACPSGCDLTANSPFSFANYNVALGIITNTAAARSLDVDVVSLRATVGNNAARRN
jgi:hypothetical protein